MTVPGEAAKMTQSGTTAERGLLEAIREVPEDDAPRLVYADWLDENGQPERAEFIRLQCRLAKLDWYDPERPDLEWRQRELLREHGKVWGKPIAHYTKRVEFHRGFIDQIAMPVGRFLDSADALFSLVPLTTLRPLQVRARWFDLLHSAHLARLRNLDLHWSALGLARGRELAACEHLANLHELSLGSNKLRPSGCAAVLGSRHLGNLRRLRLNTNESGDGPLIELASKNNFPHLRELDLSNNGIGPEGAGHLARASWLAQLERLDLAESPLLNEGIKRLTESGILAGLKSLRLTNTGADLDGVRCLAKCPHLAGLTELILSVNSPFGQSLAELARSTVLTRLRVLDYLGGTVVSDPGVDALRQSPLAANLRFLGLHNLSPAAAETLLTTRSLSGLTWLDLSSNYLGTKLAELLREAAHLENLTHLNVSGCNLNDQDVEVLAGCAHLGRLVVLHLNGNRLGKRGFDALADSPHFTRLRRLYLPYSPPAALERVRARYGEACDR
jgi:uncharacterized protein (TIGR02996 family)